MVRLRQSDLVNLLRTVSEVEAIPGLDVFPQRALSLLKTLIPADIAGYEELDLVAGKVEAKTLPADPLFDRLASDFARFFHEHPILGHVKRTGDTSAKKISDFLSQHELHRLGLYEENFRPAGIEHQMATVVHIADPRRSIGLTLERSRHDFSESDRLMLNLLRPHLAYAYWAAVTRTALGAFEDALQREHRAIVILDGRGEVLLDNAAARRLLVEYFWEPGLPPHDLPEDVWSWLRREQSQLARMDQAIEPRRPLVTTREGKRLCINFLHGATAGASRVLLLEEQQTPASLLEEPAGHTLTSRERDVLALVAAGKTNQEIADAFVVSERTVEKHLEHVYDKLGVHSRTAAVARAFGRQELASVR